MKIGVEISIDVTKIDKSKIFEGKKGKYLTATAFIDIDQQDQYGNNGMVTQKVSKEEQQQGVKGAILGNSKVFWNDSGAQPQQGGFQPQGGFNQTPQQGFNQAPQNVNPAAPKDDFADQDIPF